MVERTTVGIILESSKPLHIPSTSQWLAGQGAGSWFNIESTEIENHYNISRFDPLGSLEFNAIFIKNENTYFCIDCPYVFTYLSHYKVCHIIQHGEVFKFLNKKNNKYI